MGASSEERRQVAERLRGVTDKDLKYAFIEEILNGSMGGRCLDDEGDIDERLILNRLADLLDPTCEVVPLDEKSMRLPHCSICGHPILKPWPNFCPNCGSRIAERGRA